MNVLMISGDVQAIRNINGPFSLTLKALGERWTSLDVLCPGLPGQSREFQSNVHLFGVRKFLLFLGLWHFLRRKKYDLVVTHDYGLMLNGLTAFLVLKIWHTPHISEIHHLEGFPIAVTWKEKFYAWWGTCYIRWIGPHLQGLRIVNTGPLFQLLKQLKVSESKILVLPSIYLELEKYRPLAIAKTIDLLFVGRLADNKGIFTILEAVQELKTQGLPLRTLIKGRGPLQKKVQSFIADHHLQDLIQLDDRILNDEQMAELYNQAQILVCASTVEGGPRVTLEAMACGTPVISTSCGIMPQVIQPRQNGLLFDGTSLDLSHRLKEVFSEPALLEKLRQNSRNAVLRFDFSNTLNQYSSTYRQIIQSHTSN